MKKILALLAATMLATLAFAVPAGAQDDPVVGTVVSDPASVPEAGEYEMTATGTGFIADSTLLVSTCTAPGDVLVPGVSTEDEITETLLAATADIAANCDILGAQTATADSDGAFTATITGEVGDNFVLVAGALDLSQFGGTWVPIVDAETAAAIAAAQELAVTGVDSTDVALIGLMLVLAGGVAVAASRKLSIA